MAQSRSIARKLKTGEIGYKKVLNPPKPSVTTPPAGARLYTRNSSQGVDTVQVTGFGKNAKKEVLNPNISGIVTVQKAVDPSGRIDYQAKYSDGTRQKVSVAEYNSFYANQKKQTPTGQNVPNTSVSPQIAPGQTGTLSGDTTTPTATNSTETANKTSSTTTNDMPVDEEIPDEQSLRDEFFGSERGKILDEIDKATDDDFLAAIEAEKFRASEQQRQAKEAEQRSFANTAALQGNVGGFGFIGNAELVSGIQREGRAYLDRLETSNAITLQQMMTSGRLAELQEDATIEGEVSAWVQGKQEQVAAANQAAYERWKTERQFNFDVAKEQNENLKWLKDYDLDLQVEARQQKAQQSTEYTNMISNITSLFGFGQDFFGKNQTTDQWLGEQLAQYGIEASPNMFTDNMEVFENQLDLLSKFTNLPPSIIPMMKGIKAAELGLADSSTLSAIADAIKQDNFQKILDTANAKAIAEGSAFGGIPSYGNVSTGNINVPSSGVDPSQAQQIANSAKDQTRSQIPYLPGVLTGVEKGSDLWEFGMDIALDGGKGAPVPAGVNGTVIGTGNDANGFGNYVLIQRPNGQVMRVSHLNSIGVQQGQQVSANTPVGGQGNTGKTFGKTGIHVDYTIYQDASRKNPLSSRQVYAEMLSEGSGQQQSSNPASSAPMFTPRDAIDQVAMNVILGLDNPSNYPNQNEKNALINRVNNIRNSGQRIQVPDSIKALDLQNAKSGTANPDSAFRAQLGGYDAEYQKALQTSKPKTDFQVKSQGYASRMQQADDIITAQEKQLQDLGYLKWVALQKAPNIAKNELIQKQEQAERNFVNAVLRQESGATIPPDEFVNAQKQYFPQPGDSPAVIEQKRQNRALVIKNMQMEYEGGQGTQSTGTKVLSPAEIAKYQELINSGRGTRQQLEQALANGGYDPSQINQFTFR